MEYKYKNMVLTPVKRTLKFHKENYHFLKNLTDKITNKETGITDDEMFWDYIHTPENIKEIIDRFLEGDEKGKIIIDVETDEDYSELINLVSMVLSDFFIIWVKTKKI